MTGVSLAGGVGLAAPRKSSGYGVESITHFLFVDFLGRFRRLS